MEELEPEAPISEAQLTKRQDLNNHIVLMRHAVQKSKVHLINKLVREAKRLKERKGPEKGQEKSQRKANRLLEEVNVLKHLNKDEVSIYALQDEESLEKILSLPGATPEARTKARISHHQLVQIEVLKYRNKNQHWKLQIPTLLEKTKEKREITKQKLGRTKTKRKKTGEKQFKKEEETEPKSESGQGSDSDNFDDIDEVELVSAIYNYEDADIEDIKPDLPDLSLSAITTNPTPRSSPNRNNREKIAKKPKLSKTNPKKNSKIDKVKIQYLKDLTDLEVLETPAALPKPKSKPKSSAELEQEITQRPASSFFIGGVEREPDEDDEDKNPYWDRKTDRPLNSHRAQRDNQDTVPKPIFRKGKLINKNQAFGRGSRGRGRGQGPPRQLGRGNQGSSWDSRKPTQDTSFARPSRSAASEKLHPSWEAKKRQAQASILTSFQGKKIAFSDN